MRLRLQHRSSLPSAGSVIEVTLPDPDSQDGVGASAGSIRVWVWHLLMEEHARNAAKDAAPFVPLSIAEVAMVRASLSAIRLAISDPGYCQMIVDGGSQVLSVESGDTTLTLCWPDDAPPEWAGVSEICSCLGKISFDHRDAEAYAEPKGWGES
jgi:hypothetical protein